MRKKLKTMNDKLLKDIKMREYYSQKNSELGNYKKNRKSSNKLLKSGNASPKHSNNVFTPRGLLSPHTKLSKLSHRTVDWT